MVIPPGAAKLLYPEIFPRCRNLERDDKRRLRRKVWQSARSAPIQILSELTIKEHRGIRTWLRALLETGNNNRTLLVAHIHSLHFGTFQKYPGGERRLEGAHQRRRGQGAKPGRGGRDAVSRRSSPGILLSLRAERALSGGAGVKLTKLRAPLPGVDFRIKRALKPKKKEDRCF